MVIHLGWTRQSNLDWEDNCLCIGVVWFQWDPKRSAANLPVHGVSFTEAVTVFDDDFALTRKDPGAADEPRFVTLGLGDLGNLVVVVYTYR